MSSAQSSAQSSTQYYDLMEELNFETIIDSEKQLDDTGKIEENSKEYDYSDKIMLIYDKVNERFKDIKLEESNAEELKNLFKNIEKMYFAEMFDSDKYNYYVITLFLLLNTLYYMYFRETYNIINNSIEKRRETWWNVNVLYYIVQKYNMNKWGLIFVPKRLHKRIIKVYDNIKNIKNVYPDISLYEKINLKSAKELEEESQPPKKRAKIAKKGKSKDTSKDTSEDTSKDTSEDTSKDTSEYIPEVKYFDLFGIKDDVEITSEDWEECSNYFSKEI